MTQESCTAADMSPPPNPARMIGGVVDSTTSPASVTFRTRFLLVPLTVTTCSTRGAMISAFAMSSPAFGQYTTRPRVRSRYHCPGSFIPSRTLNTSYLRRPHAPIGHAAGVER